MSAAVNVAADQGERDLLEDGWYLGKLLELATIQPDSFTLKASGVLKLINEINRLQRELDAARRPAAQGQALTDWQPIETAPQDGYMLVHEDEAMRALLRIKGAWHQAAYPAIISHPWNEVIVGDDAKRILPPGYRLELRDGCCENPTHWMPMPPPPEARITGQQPQGEREV